MVKKRGLSILYASWYGVMWCCGENHGKTSLYWLQRLNWYSLFHAPNWDCPIEIYPKRIIQHKHSCMGPTKKWNTSLLDMVSWYFNTPYWDCPKEKPPKRFPKETFLKNWVRLNVQKVGLRVVGSREHPVWKNVFVKFSCKTRAGT